MHSDLEGPNGSVFSVIPQYVLLKTTLFVIVSALTLGQIVYIHR